LQGGFCATLTAESTGKRMAERSRGFVRAGEGECALGNGDGEYAFTLAAMGAEFEKFRLESEELFVERDVAVANVTRMEVADVAVRVAVAGLENDAVVAITDNDVEEYLALAVIAGGGAVAVGGVADFNLEGEAALVVADDTEFPELVAVASMMRSSSSTNLSC
jgi:hypothetical protein